MDPYKSCPVFESDNFLLRFVDEEDASDLLLVYSDKLAVPFFNNDNCSDDFYYTTLEEVKKEIEYWHWEYNRKGFVRWTILNKHTHHAIGTIELFNRTSDDYFHNCGLLRLDLKSDFEKTEIIFEIVSLITKDAFDLFKCTKLATKVPSFAIERKKAVERIGFVETKEKLIGNHGHHIYFDYYVLQK